MASAYQLLLHTRLVGLGKRFDRTSVAAPIRRRRAEDDDEDDSEHEEEEDEEDEGPSPTIGTTTLLDQNPPLSAKNAPPVPPPPPVSSVEATATENGTGTPGGSVPPSLLQLTSILPSNLEMDTSMMEHLARAAVELHHQRTGRKKSADGLLASPMTGLIGSASASPGGAAGAGDTTKVLVAWTPHEQEILLKASKEKKPPHIIAKLLPSKTEAQVKAFLKNQQKNAQTSSQIGEELASPNSKRRGGRGRKPPTTAMNTVPNANLDAKALLKGFLNK
jgi:hypothetical protein